MVHQNTKNLYTLGLTTSVSRKANAYALRVKSLNLKHATLISQKNIYFKIITSGQSNLTRGHIAAAHGQFSGIRQVAPVCTPPNRCFFGPTQVQIPNGISISSAVFAQLTADCRRACPGMSFPLKLPLCMAIWTISNTCFLGPT